jgi:hypothetical protein
LDKKSPPRPPEPKRQIGRHSRAYGVPNTEERTGASRSATAGHSRPIGDPDAGRNGGCTSDACRQCNTANTTMMAALSEPITANGRSSLRYCIATSTFRVRLQRRSAPFWFDNRKKKSCCICQGGILGTFSPHVDVDQHRLRKKRSRWLAPQVAAQRPHCGRARRLTGTPSGELGSHR